MFHIKYLSVNVLSVKSAVYETRGITRWNSTGNNLFRILHILCFSILPLPYPFFILSFLRWSRELQTSPPFRLWFILRWYQYLRLHGVERNDNWPVMDWKGIERKWPWPTRGTIPTFAWKTDVKRDKPQLEKLICRQRFEDSTSSV
jgi:hypothetical protein